MKQEITKGQFIDALMSDPYANWTYNQASAIYDYLEELDKNYEFDLVGIRCSFNGYYTLADMLESYDEESLEDLENEVTVIECGDGEYVSVVGRL